MKATIQALLLAIACLACAPSAAQVGTWRNYLSYHEPQQIAAASGNEIFVLASNALYQYNTADGQITTYDKVNGMNGVDITNIAWNKAAKRLIATYANSNIDLVDTNGNITNISDLYSKSTTDDKTINSIRINDRHAYLCTNFGIVKADMIRAEISETYNLQMPIDAAAVSGGNILARTKSGAVLTAPMGTNLQDPANWQYTTDFAPTIFDRDLSDWNKYIDVVKTLNPGGPKYNYFAFMKFANNKLYTCGGGTTGIQVQGCIQVLNDRKWEIFQEEGITEQTGVNYVNITTLDIDPKDDTHLFAGARNGLYEFRDGRFVNFYNSTNSPIESFDDNSIEYELVTSVAFDETGVLWLLNSQAATQSLIKYADGKFISCPQPELMKLSYGSFKNRSNTKMVSMFFDSNKNMWFVNDAWRLPAIYQYNTSGNVMNAYETIVNQDGITTTGLNGIPCVTEDREHNIWIGTDLGPFMLERDEINRNGTTFTQVKIPRNDGTNYADYLLSGAAITSIAVDGGNNKWFGTGNSGVYLISADNMTQTYNFTSENSPLLSNTIQYIAINDATGEVFFSTDKGLCSYINNATMPSENMTKDNVYAYPNPVTPDYNGLVTITGLSYNAEVKIASANGVLVAQGRSNGGAFTWDCNDLRGKRVASGIYMVEAATENGGKGTVCKIAIVR